MSITPGFRHDKKFVVMALRRDSDTKGADYIAAGAQPLAILTKGLAVDPYQSEQITRDLDTGEQGGEKVIHAGEMMTLTIPVEIAGSGDASSAAADAEDDRYGGSQGCQQEAVGRRQGAAGLC